VAFAHIGSLGRGFGRVGAWIASFIETPGTFLLDFTEANNSQYIVVMGI
jgi:hypothetical protein